MLKPVVPLDRGWTIGDQRVHFAVSSKADLFDMLDLDFANSDLSCGCSETCTVSDMDTPVKVRML